MLWDNALAYLKAPPVSMPNVDEDNKPTDLKSDIGNYRYTYRDGVLLMESKKEYKKRAGQVARRWRRVDSHAHTGHDDTQAGRPGTERHPIDGK
jgi:hypothetical protein